jgi:MEMO1 family protein
MKPKLRPLDIQPVTHQGRESILLRDPLHLAPGQVIIPKPWGPILAFCDGTRELAELRAALAVRTGLVVSLEVLQQVVQHLDDALVLESEHFEEACQAALTSYREAPQRPLASAGGSYPENPEAARTFLAEFAASAGSLDETAEAQTIWRGLISPHIDYARGGTVYARTWGLARRTLQQVDLVIIFGTDHSGGPGRVTLTRQNYATPFGVLPTEQGVVQAVAKAVGPEAAFAEELHHRHEHSIELAAIWLHYFLGERTVPLVPVLCGSFAPFIQGTDEPLSNPTIDATLSALTEATAGRQTLVVAAADLAHMGPAFGDPRPLDFADRARLQAADEALLATMAAGDPDAFLQIIRQEEDRRRICGVPPITMALRLLGHTEGALVAYDRCPADAAGGSLVSICGMLLR